MSYFGWIFIIVPYVLFLTSLTQTTVHLGSGVLKYLTRGNGRGTQVSHYHAQVLAQATKLTAAQASYCRLEGIVERSARVRRQFTVVHPHLDVSRLECLGSTCSGLSRVILLESVCMGDGLSTSSRCIVSIFIFPCGDGPSKKGHCTLRIASKVSLLSTSHRL